MKKDHMVLEKGFQNLWVLFLRVAGLVHFPRRMARLVSVKWV